MTRHPTAVAAEMAARRVLGVRSGLVMMAVFYAIVAGVLSAAFVASVPGELIQHLDLPVPLAFVAVTLILAAVAAATFRAALRRYTSGSSWTQA